MAVDSDLDRSLFDRLAQLAGSAVADVRQVQRGYTPAIRLVVSLASGASAFAKIGATAQTAGNLRREKQVYESLSGPFMPGYLGWDDDGVMPILLLEDLSQAYWPPPWREGDVRRVLETLPRLWASRLPAAPELAGLTRLLDGWLQVAENPEPFLALGLATEAWLGAALPVLLDIDAGAAAQGNALLHMDIRSDNICLRNESALIVDWNLVCRGSPRFDLGAWLPSLEAEGGPPPESILPDAADIAGLVSGFFAARAGLPAIPEAPAVRDIQLTQLRKALPWAVRALGLPPLDSSQSQERYP